MNSIFDKFQTVASCKYYTKQVADKLNLDTFDYFWDGSSETQFPGNSDIYKFEEFRYEQPWKIKFNLTKPKTIMKIGLEEYVSKYKELAFNLTLKGHRFLYIVKFYEKQESNFVIEETVPDEVITPTFVFDQDIDGQLSFVFN